MSARADVLERVAAVLEARRNADPSRSYVAGLYEAGVDAVLKKIGEESAELIVAGKAGAQREVVHEAADLWFHTLVLLAMRGLGPDDVLAELERRFGRSGVEEKAARDS